jgi:hypothetical protein
MPVDVAVISDLAAEEGVDALISVEPVLAIMDKGLSATYTQKTFQSGDTIRIRIEDQPMMPNQSNVIQLDPVLQQEISATVLQYNDGCQLGGIEQEYALGGLERVRERIFRPRMKNMAVQAAVLCYEELATASNYFGTAGTAPKTAADWAVGQALLNDQLAMDDGLYAIMSNQTMAETAGDLATKFNPTDDSATAYMKGRVQKAANLNFFSTSNIPNHTNGDAVGNGSSGMVVATNVTSGATSVAVSGGTSAGTITANSLIWFRNRWAVQPNTKKTLSTLRYVTVTESVTLSGGAGTINFSPALYGPEEPKLQNISALPVVTTDYVGIVGTASHTYEQAIVVKKGASAFIGLELPDLTMQKVSQSNYEGVTIKVSAGSDLMNYINMIRWDILCTAKNRQWRHIARAFTRDLG